MDEMIETHDTDLSAANGETSMFFNNCLIIEMFIFYS